MLVYVILCGTNKFNRDHVLHINLNIDHKNNQTETENITKKNSYTDASVIRSPYETRRRLIIRDVLLYCDVLLLRKSKKKNSMKCHVLSRTIHWVEFYEPTNQMSVFLKFFNNLYT